MKGSGGMRGEGGFALMLALAVLVVLGISVTALIDYTGSSLRSSDVSKTRKSAFDVAEAGLQDALAVIGNAAATADPTQPTLLGCNGGTCTPLVFNEQGGTATVTGTYSLVGSTPTWTITSIGRATYKGAAGQQQTKRLTATTGLTPPPNQQNPNAAIWNYVMSTAPQGTGCEMDLTGTNVTVDVPIYVTGDLCLTGTNAQILENTAGGGQKVDVTVMGSITYNGANATIGQSGAPITSASVGQGCRELSTGALHSCSSATDKFFVKSAGTPLAITPPVGDLTWWSRADPGPKHPCQSGTVPTFDNDAATTTASNDSVTAAPVNLTPVGNYTCKSSDGGVTGEISWNDTTNVLTVKGTIFIDGNVTVTQTATYSGRATLYLAGKFTMNGVNQSLCATVGCNFSTWNPNTTMLLIGSLANNEPNAIDLNGTNNSFQGGFFTQPTSTVNLNGTNISYEGPIVGGRFTWATNTSIKPLPPISQQPPGAPLQPNVQLEPSPLVYTSG